MPGDSLSDLEFMLGKYINTWVKQVATIAVN